MENVTVLYRGIAALDNVSLKIQAETITGLIGPNGAGKTTLLRAFVGLVKPDSGRVSVFGHPPGEAHNLIGYVPQLVRVESNFPVQVQEVVMMGRYGHLGPGRFAGLEDRKAVEEAMARVNIGELSKKRFGALSGGEKQKTLIARALCSRPRLLLLDEPTTGVDSPSQDSFYQLLHKLKKDLGMTILLVSHDIGVITSHADDLICINQKVYSHGAPGDAAGRGLIGEAYGCEAEILLHGHSAPHRVVGHHSHKERNDG
jgi:zinc transport system ATP-binding protein